MVARAEAKYIRISPQKMRMVTDVVRGMAVNDAVSVLNSLNKKGAAYLGKVLRSALSNAKNKGFDEAKLFISRLAVNGGPSFKRYRAASFGRAATIRKRMAHIIVEIDSSEKIVKS
ncbi:MAG: 50S ribosomal protein L22 [Candidatus Omnitrophota bacterium]